MLAYKLCLMQLLLPWVFSSLASQQDFFSSSCQQSPWNLLKIYQLEVWVVVHLLYNPTIQKLPWALDHWNSEGSCLWKKYILHYGLASITYATRHVHKEEWWSHTSIRNLSNTQKMITLTHWGRVMQICVFTLQLCKTDDANLRF